MVDRGETMKYDAIVVGGGVAGLTASAFLAKAGLKLLVCEKESTCGGLVNSFNRDGFVFDGGIRAMENSGVLFPMLKSLGLDVKFVKNKVTLGFEDKVIRVESEESLVDYRTELEHLYPDNCADIAKIMAEIQRIMHYMKVQYGIDNPVFLDMKKDREYMLKKILPWVFQYAVTAPKISALNVPVVDFLQQFTQNQSLVDIITQHFFRSTPAFFALSYLSLYNDYYYPVGGTAKLVEALVSFIESHHGTIHTATRIVRVDIHNKTITDDKGNEHQYERLIWAADQKTLYRVLDLKSINDSKVNAAVEARKMLIADKAGNDSVLTMFLGVRMPPEYFARIASEHFFYTPKRTGQSQAGPLPLDLDRAGIEDWLKKFFELTTYEIAFPVLRDPTLAPQGATGLIVSVLFDYQLTKTIEKMGWYEDFKSYCETCMIDALEKSIFPGIKKAVMQRFSSTPITIEKYSGNTDGAITGWALYNDPVPAESRIPKIMNAVATPISHVYQAGQWSYSPSGFPIALISGKIAADKVIQDLKNRK